MNILENYYKKIIRYDLINKFPYARLNKLPELKKVILSFKYEKLDMKHVVSVLVSLELMTMRQELSAKSRRSNILLKVEKGQPISCTIVLTKKEMYRFLFKFLSEITTNFKTFKNQIPSEPSRATGSFFILKNLVSFKELERHFYLFTELPPLNVIFVWNTNVNKELPYLMSSFKLLAVSNI